MMKESHIERKQEIICISNLAISIFTPISFANFHISIFPHQRQHHYGARFCRHAQGGILVFCMHNCGFQLQINECEKWQCVGATTGGEGG